MAFDPHKGELRDSLIIIAIHMVTDYVPFQLKDFERLNCLLITTDLFGMFLSIS